MPPEEKKVDEVQLSEVAPAETDDTADGEAPDADDVLFDEALATLESKPDEGEEAKPKDEPATEPTAKPDEAKGEEAKVAPEAPKEPPAEEPKPEAEAKPAPSEPEPVAPPEPVKEAVPAAEPAKPAEPAAVELTATQIQERWAKEREEAIAALAAEHYKLDPAVVETLDPGLAEAVPTLMARVYVDAVSSAMQRVLQILPQAVASVMDARTKSDASEVAFYEKWPQLRAHHEKVGQFAQAYRAVNPAADAANFIQDVGAQVSVALRIPIEAAAAEVPAAPAPIVSDAPFVPAKGGGSGAAKPQPLNQFETLADEWLEEDRL